MRQIVPQSRRERTVNYGVTETVIGSERKTTGTVHKGEGDSMLLTVMVEEFFIPKAAIGTADFRPMISIDWGNGASSAETEIDVTYRQRFPFAASTADVECFIKAFPFPNVPAAKPPKVPDDARAKFRAFVSEGIDGERLFPTRWVTQLGEAAGVFADAQARLASVRAFNPATAGAPVFFLLFDQATAPAGGEIPFDGAPLPLTNGTTTSLVPIPLGETRGFVHGIAWGISSTPFVFTPAAVPVFAVAELLQ